MEDKSIISLGAIEYRMARARADIYGGALELGRCLIEAKEGGLVAHGEWEAWVARNAEMSVRSAEKLMKRAREVQDGTALSRLSGSKIDRILALPEEQREELAAKAEAENLSTREIEKEISQLRGQLDAANIRADALQADADRAYEDGKKAGQEWMQERIDRMHWTMDQQQREINQVREQAEQAEKRAQEAWDEGYKTAQIDQKDAETEMETLSAAAAAKDAEIEKLKTELERTVAFATRANEDKKRLQQQLHDAADDTARETGVSLAEGARRDVAAFLASAAGQLPYMQGRIDRLGADDLDTLRALVTAVKKWAIATDTILATAGALEVVS